MHYISADFKFQLGSTDLLLPSSMFDKRWFKKGGFDESVYCPVLQQVWYGRVTTWHFSTAGAVNGCKTMNDARLGWQCNINIEPCSCSYITIQIRLFADNMRNITFPHLPFIPHWIQWWVLGSDGLSQQPSRQLRRQGFFNFDIRVHNIWIRRLLAKTVMLVDEDLTGNFKDLW